MKAAAHDDGCEGCHAPLGNLIAEGELAIDEGVTCEACHAIRDVEINKKAGFQYQYGLAENRKFGPLCDAKDNYFHKMGCAPLFHEAKMCAGCHAFSIQLEGGNKLPIFEEYDEWLASSFAAAGVACQECHMPGEIGQAATGTSRTTKLGHHGFMGNGGDLLRKALSVVVNAREEADRIVADVVLKNEGAGHHVPSGMPGRQVLVRARALDAKGNVQASEERSLGRVLTGADGNEEVPFYAAKKESADDRIEPGKSRSFSFSFVAPRAGELRVEVVWRSLSPPLAKTLGQTAEERPMATVVVPFGERSVGKTRALLPKTMVYKP